MFSRTTDGGATWEAPRELFDPGALADAVGAEIFVLPDDEVIALFDADYVHKDGHGLRGRNIAVMRSSDHGGTWSPPSFGPKMPSTAALDPLTGNTIAPRCASLTLPSIPSAAPSMRPGKTRASVMAATTTSRSRCPLTGGGHGANP
jgi:hypothetical protein